MTDSDAALAALQADVDRLTAERDDYWGDTGTESRWLQCKWCRLYTEGPVGEALVGRHAKECPLAALLQARQERDAQFAHNTQLIEQIAELDKDNAMYGDYLGKIEGIVNGTGSTGTIKWDLDERIRQLAAGPAQAARAIARLPELQIAVLAILDNAGAYSWSAQGFGLLRLYIRNVGRLHIWDSALRYPGVSMVHNHSWDLHSTIVAGRLVNTRYLPTGGESFHGKRLVTGYQTHDVVQLPDSALRACAPEVYSAGDDYVQEAREIHRTDADDGTISLMLRHEDEHGQADVYWPAGTEWGTAKPRQATADEVAATVAKALALLAAGAAGIAPRAEPGKDVDEP